MLKTSLEVFLFNSLEKEAETQWNVQKAMISMKKGEE